MIKDDPEPEWCMALDRWGEFNCCREKGHENNLRDKKAKLHQAKWNGTIYEWKGHGTSKPTGRYSQR